MTAVRKTGGDALSTDFKLSYAEKGVSLETQPALKKVRTGATPESSALPVRAVISHGALPAPTTSSAGAAARPAAAAQP